MSMVLDPPTARILAYRNRLARPDRAGRPYPTLEVVDWPRHDFQTAAVLLSHLVRVGLPPTVTMELGERSDQNPEEG